MTIITYADNALYADTKSVYLQGHEETFAHASKINKSPCGRFAFAKAGLCLEGTAFETFSSALLRCLMLFYQSGRQESDFQKFYKDMKKAVESTIIITHDDVWVCTAELGAVVLSKLDEDVILGSGLAIFSAARQLGYNAKDAMQATVDQSFGCGGIVECLPRSSLKPFKFLDTSSKPKSKTKPTCPSSSSSTKPSTPRA